MRASILSTGTFLSPSLVRRIVAATVCGTCTSSIAFAQAAAQSPGAEAHDTVDEVVVYGQDLRGSETATTATRMPMSIKDTPQTVKVISQDVIAFSGLKTVDDLSKVDASTGGTGRNRWGSADLSFRGFDLDFLNGIRMDGFRLLPVVLPDLENVESLEIVKGPVSTQYGQASLGGTINIVSKKPERQSRQQVRLQAGQWNAYRADVDSTGPLTEDGRLRYRVLVGYEDSESFIDYFGRESKSFTPSIAYDFNENASILVSGQIQNASLAASNGGPLTAEGTLPDVPRSFYWGQSWNSRDTRLRMGNAIYTQMLGQWTWRTALQYNSSNFDILYGQPLIFVPMQPDGSVSYQSLFAHSDQRLKGGETTLFGPFQAFGREHTLFFAADGYDRNIDYLQFSEFYGFAPVFNIFNPNYNLPKPDTSQVPGAFLQHQRVYGATAQVQLHLTDRLTTLIGARYDHAKFDINGVDTGQGDAKTVGQVGVTYAVRPNINLYANYGQTFLPQEGVTFPDLANVGSQEGDQIEIGMKGDFLQNKLFVSVALFDMNRSHIQQDDPLNPGYSILLGKQRSRGVEVDTSGKIADRLDIYGSFAWIDSEFTEGAFDGLHPATTPKLAGSLYANYQLTGALSPVGLGIGVIHKQGIPLGGFGPFAFSPSQREVSPFDEYTLVDLRVTYRPTRQLFFSAAVSNVLDKTYYYDYQGWGSFTQAGEPRRVRAEMSYTF